MGGGVLVVFVLCGGGFCVDNGGFSVGVGVLVVFVLCGGGFCVDSGGFFVGAGGFFDIKFVWKLRKLLRKCEKFCRKIAFLECYQTLEIIFQTIFHCTPKRPDFNFLMRIHFCLHSF